MLVVENTNFGAFSRRLSFVRLALQEVRNRSGLQPEWVIERAVQPRSSINSASLRSSERFLRPSLPLRRLGTRSRLPVQRKRRAQKRHKKQTPSTPARLSVRESHSDLQDRRIATQDEDLPKS